jgi:hypothetical protein
LCRIFLDLYEDVEFYEKLKKDGKSKWTIKIDAIEAFQEYSRFIPKWAYDDIMFGNVLDLLPKIDNKRYDLILTLAVIEHLTKEEGTFFINELKRIGEKIILSVPKQWKEQSSLDNPYEEHKSHWTDSELRTLGFNRFLPHWDAWIAVYDPDFDETDIHVGSDATAQGPQIVTPASNNLSEIRSSVKRLEETSHEILNSQQKMLGRLSFSLRARDFINRLKDPFRKDRRNQE